MNLIFQKWNSKFSIFNYMPYRQFCTLNISIIIKKLIDDLKSQLTNRFLYLLFFRSIFYCKCNERDRRNGGARRMNGTGGKTREREEKSHCEWDDNEESVCTFVCVDMHSLAYSRALTARTSSQTCRWLRAKWSGYVCDLTSSRHSADRAGTALHVKFTPL